MRSAACPGAARKALTKRTTGSKSRAAIVLADVGEREGARLQQQAAEEARVAPRGGERRRPRRSSRPSARAPPVVDAAGSAPRAAAPAPRRGSGAWRWSSAYSRRRSGDGSSATIIGGISSRWIRLSSTVFRLAKRT